LAPSRSRLDGHVRAHATKSSGGRDRLSLQRFRRCRGGVGKHRACKKVSCKGLKLRHAAHSRRNLSPQFLPPRASPPAPPGSSSCASPAAGGRKDARDVAAGRAFICDKSGLALDRGNRHHLFHRGLTTRARKGASPLRQIGHDTFQQMLTTINAPQFRRLRPHGPFTAGRFLLKYMPARGRGRPGAGQHN
jgi:hypothetical protein